MLNRTKRKKDMVGGFNLFNKTVKQIDTGNNWKSLSKQEKIIKTLIKNNKNKQIDVFKNNIDSLEITKIVGGRGGAVTYNIKLKDESEENGTPSEMIYKQSSTKQKSAPREFIVTKKLYDEFKNEFDGGYCPFPEPYDIFMMNNGITFGMFFNKFSSPRYLQLDKYFADERVTTSNIVNTILNLIYILYTVHNKYPFFQHQDLHPHNIFIDTTVEHEKTLRIGKYSVTFRPNIYLIDFDLVVGIPTYVYSPAIKNRKISMAFSDLCGVVTHKVLQDFKLRSPISLYNLSDYEFINNIYICLVKLLANKNELNLSIDGFITREIKNTIKKKKAELLCNEYDIIPFEVVSKNDSDKNVIGVESNIDREKSNNTIYDSLLDELNKQAGFNNKITLGVLNNDINEIVLNDYEMSQPLKVADASLQKELMDMQSNSVNLDDNKYNENNDIGIIESEFKEINRPELGMGMGTNVGMGIAPVAVEPAMGMGTNPGMGMETNPGMGMNTNMGMGTDTNVVSNPGMGTNTNMGMEPGMGTNTNMGMEPGMGTGALSDKNPQMQPQNSAYLNL